MYKIPTDYSLLVSKLFNLVFNKGGFFFHSKYDVQISIFDVSYGKWSLDIKAFYNNKLKY